MNESNITGSALDPFHRQVVFRSEMGEGDSRPFDKGFSKCLIKHFGPPRSVHGSPHHDSYTTKQADGGKKQGAAPSLNKPDDTAVPAFYTTPVIVTMTQPMLHDDKRRQVPESSSKVCEPGEKNCATFLADQGIQKRAEIAADDMPILDKFEKEVNGSIEKVEGLMIELDQLLVSCCGSTDKKTVEKKCNERNKPC